MPGAPIGMIALFAAAAFRDSSTQASATDDPQACTFAAALPGRGVVRYFVRAAPKHGQAAEGFAGEVDQLAHVSILPVPAFMLLDEELPAREHGFVGRGHLYHRQRISLPRHEISQGTSSGISLSR